MDETKISREFKSQLLDFPARSLVAMLTELLRLHLLIETILITVGSRVGIGNCDRTVTISCSCHPTDPRLFLKVTWKVMKQTEAKRANRSIEHS
jgi:hypothetical protein